YLKKQGGDVILEKSLYGMMIVIKLTIWIGAIIFLLDNLGFKVSTVVAGLGIGGVAVALAAQTILKDLFSYFCIIFDKPFKVGDFIIVDDFMGTVEHIGIKTTRIRSLNGEVLIFF
ncbi:MAG: mechanosensitive ion channel family protein, partial [Candidatus Omnitrophica bacterium]|nr:mechanosensitive ion channel family protein [Candidatus Omnitrophota bacterium]